MPQRTGGKLKNGQMWGAKNATPGTSIAHEVLTGFNADKSLLTLTNASTTKTLIPEQIRLIVETAPASATATEAVLSVDPTARYSSGGTQLTQKACDTGNTATSDATCWFGAVALATATSTVRYVDRMKLRQAILVVGDQICLVFGNGEGSGMALNGTNPQQIIISVPEVVLAPSDCMNLHVWHPGNSATASKFEVGVSWREIG